MAANARDKTCAWMVWTAWRGDPKHFAQIARRAMEVLRERSPRCVIELHVLDDTEHFESPDEFVDVASRQAVRGFDRAEIKVVDDVHTVTVTFSREKPRGVTLEVRAPAAGRPSAEQIRDAVAPTITRGGFRRARGPREARSRAELLSVQRTLNRRRARWLALVHSMTFGVLCVLTLLLLGEPLERSLGIGLGVLTLVFLALVVVGLAWPRRTDVVFPAIDLADVTPGRRNAQLLRLVPVAPAVTWFVDKVQ